MKPRAGNLFPLYFLSALAWLAAGPAAARGAEPAPTALTNQLVGAWTDFGRIEFTGLKTFTAQQLRSALLRDVPYLLASHPQAPRAPFLLALESRLTDGFRGAGFPEARVRATLDEAARRVRVNITEGPRYFAGPVKITGAVTVPVTNLVRRLTEKWVPTGLPAEANTSGAGTYVNSAGEKVEEEKPLWELGKPASFDAASLEFITRRLTNVLAESGCFFATVKPRVAIVPGTDRAELHIDLDEGRPARLGHIHVHGLKRNSVPAVLQWLGLAPGQPLAGDLIGRVERQLWYSARFIRYRVVPAPVPGKPDVADLELTLEELPEAPLLGKEFSRAEQTLLKTREWLMNTLAHGDDLVATAEWNEVAGEFEFILSQHGFTAVNRASGSLRFAAAAGHGRAAFFSFPRRRKLAVSGDDNRLVVYLSILPEKAGEDGGRFGIQIGAGVKSGDDDKPGASPIQIDFALAPVAFIHLAHPTNHTMKFEGDSLVFTGDGLTVSFDAASGRLTKLQQQGGTNEVKGEVRIERGAFDRRWKELEAATAGFSDRIGTNQPYSALFGILGAEWVGLQFLSTNLPPTTADERARAVAALEKVYTRSLAFIDPLLASRATATNSFSIPSPPLESGQSAQLSGMAKVAAFVFEYADQFLPARSWPWTLARETVFTLGNQGRHTEAELKVIYESDDSGPLAFLSTALLLNLVNSPAAQRFATRGLERLSPADFQKDCRLVLDPVAPLGRMFLDTARALRDLPPDDVDALAAVLRKRDGAILRILVGQLKAAPDAPLADTLAPLLEEYWKSDLRRLVENGLRSVVGETAATSERQRLYDEGWRATQEKLYPDAAASFRKAAEMGMPQAQYVFAQFVEKGTGVPPDETAALRWYRLAATNGVKEAQMALGSHYSTSFDGPDDAVEAFFWYSLAAKSGDRAATAYRNVAQRKLTPEQLAAAQQRLELHSRNNADSSASKPK